MFCNSIQNKVCPFLIRQYQSTVEIQKNKANDENLPWFDVSFALTVVLLKHRFPGIFCIIINILNENFSQQKCLPSQICDLMMLFGELKRKSFQLINRIHSPNSRFPHVTRPYTRSRVFWKCLMNEMCKFINKTDGSHTELENVYIV